MCSVRKVSELISNVDSVGIIRFHDVLFLSLFSHEIFLITCEKEYEAISNFLFVYICT